MCWQLHSDVIQNYAGGADAKPPKLNKSGGTGVATRPRLSVTRVGGEIVAQDLVKLYAARQAQQGFVYGHQIRYGREEFEEMFPYEETEDQLHGDRGYQARIWKVTRSWIA